ncbi:MAG TPA: isoprenylcysteine carboxylmethyltransferase family protein [Pirellulaceae bacterium]
MPSMSDEELKALRGRVVKELVRMPVFLGLMIFVPAWSVNYWEAWLYLGLFSASVTGVTLHLLRYDPALIARRMEVGPAAETERSQQIIQGITGALSCAVFIVAGVEHRIHGSVVAWPGVLVANGGLLMGLVIVLFVFRANSYTAATVRVEAGQQVVDVGPYAWVRHPMYSGSILGYLATPIALGSLWGLVPAALVCAMIVVRLLDEERYLAKNLAGYEEYRRRVRWRLVPGVW